MPNIFIKQTHIGRFDSSLRDEGEEEDLLSGGCDDTLAALKEGRVAALLNPRQTERILSKEDLDSYDYDLIVVGGGSGGLACSKVRPASLFSLFSQRSSSRKHERWERRSASWTSFNQHPSAPAGVINTRSRSLSPLQSLFRSGWNVCQRGG